MLRVCTRCQLASRGLMQSPAVACRKIEPPSSSAVPAAEKPFSPCRHWSMGRVISASRASSSPSKENSRHILTNAASFGWNLPKLEKKQLFFFDAKMGPDVIKAGEFDLSGMLAGIKAEADARGARRIVFDAVDALLSLLDDPLAERREIYRLGDWLSESGLTGIITAKSEGDDPSVDEGYGFMQFMVDCVVALKLRVVDQIALRYVQVIKYRGSSFAENEAPLVIGASGMEVADISATTVAPEASQARVSSGVERLDAMFGSGYFRGSSVLITGSAGTGKSILAGAFAEAACLRKEHTLYVS